MLGKKTASGYSQPNPKQDIQNLVNRYKSAKDSESQLISLILEKVAAYESIQELAAILTKLNQ